MKKRIIALLLLCIPILSIGQIPRVQKLIDGKICDTCFVKNDMSFSKILPYAFIGTYSNPQRLSNELKVLKTNPFRKEENSKYSKSFGRHSHIITDSIFRLVFVTEFDNTYRWPIVSDQDKNYDYKQIEIRIEKNNDILFDWQILGNLPPLEGYQLNRFTDEDAKNGISEQWASTHQSEDFHLYYNDLLTISFRKIDTKEIVQQSQIKRVMDKPNHFDYYQTSVNSTQFKESLQSFLNDPINSKYIRKNDTTDFYVLQRNNVGVLVFNSLENGEEIEYSFDKNNPWKSIINNGKSAFQHKYIILDNEDIPPGTTKTLYLRYKNQPETEIPITIRGIEDITQLSYFKIIAGFMLASLLFGILYYFKRRITQKRLALLDQKNKDIQNQLSLLSGQLNPHFLFNSFNAIQGTIFKNDIQTTNTYITEVAGFLRCVMDDGKKEFISLQEELKLEEDYLKLEQRRKPFKYNIVVTNDVQPNEIDFPPLLIQPILENSIRHAFTKAIQEPMLEIYVKKEADNLIIQIKDNGLHWETDKINEGQGLSLIQSRMNVYNQKLTSMTISMHTTYANGTITSFTFKNWLL